MPNRLRRLISPVAPPPRAEREATVDDIYRRLLGRPADPEGLAHHVARMEAGATGADIAITIAESQEYKQRIASVPRYRRPEQYRTVVDTSGNASLVFDITEPADFDWLESRINDDGYYEHVGVWSLDIDDDKRVMAEILAGFGAKRALEIGCASGGVLRALAGHGVQAEGVEISSMARDHAPDDIRDRIHLGDLLDLDLPADYDLVFGLDIFEHLNPNRLDKYLAALHERLVKGGVLFAVVPAFGTDAVFGEPFPLYLDEWQTDLDGGRLFAPVFCDHDGYPLHGHLINASTGWWLARFAAAGFQRHPELERPVHERYAEHFAVAPARRSFYIFTSRSASGAR
jgi:SAM-dependent methyltransferase